MPASALLLYGTTVLIWGSTWLGIKYQLGVVDPLVSVIYRYLLATALLFLWCLLRRAPLRLGREQHRWIALQGACLFGLNYWIIYWSEVYLTSGIVAAIFAMLVFLNMFNAHLFLGRPLERRMLLGALIGISGIGAVFWPEFTHLSLEDRAIRGLLLGLLATSIASIGNIVATHNARFGLPVISVNAWGMLYGTLLLLAIALLTRVQFALPQQESYWVALVFLAVFGSIIAFGAYLRLLALIGPARAGYSSMLIPVVALLISTVAEGYRWTAPAIAGLALIVGGNALVLRRRA
jgi:drug/metabolite transporter (DMT)-like permease